MSDDATALALTAFFPLAFAFYVCCYGPGHAWWRGRASAIPRAFARFALSLLATTVAALVLIALERFSFPALVGAAGALTLAGYLGVGRVRYIEIVSSPAPGRAGAVVFAAALMLYWPPFEAHLAASDASSYLAAGVHLAHEHKFTKADDLGPLVPPIARGQMFFSVLGLPWKPPYSRIHGGLVTATPGAPQAVPSFFPLPSAWSGVFADALGARHAGAYAGLFAAGAIWAAWLLARRRLGFLGATIVTVLTAVNAAAYWAGKMALSEPLAWFFIVAALVALDGYEEEGFSADARLAGALLGAAALVRIEYAAFVAAAVAARVALRATLAGSRPLGGGFVLALAALLALTVAEIRLVPGAYSIPVTDVAGGLEWLTRSAWSASPVWAIAACGGALALYVLAIRRIGFLRATAAAVAIAFFAVYYRFSPDRDVARSVRWLGLYIGWPAVTLGAFGALLAWRGRFAEPAGGFLVILFAVVTSCLLFDPHVYGAMPWASRRFVPLVIPLLLLFAGGAAAWCSRRSMLAGLLAWSLLVAGTLAPARHMWSRGFYEGTYDQLRELVTALPAEGSLLLDNRLVPMLLGPPLWLAYDRNSLPVLPATTDGRNVIAGMARILTIVGKGPVYLIKPTLTPGQEDIPVTLATRVSDLTLQIALPEQTDGRPPARIEHYTQPIAIYRLFPLFLPPS